MLRGNIHKTYLNVSKTNETTILEEDLCTMSCVMKTSVVGGIQMMIRSFLNNEIQSAK